MKCHDVLVAVKSLQNKVEKCDGDTLIFLRKVFLEDIKTKKGDESDNTLLMMSLLDGFNKMGDKKKRDMII